MVIHRRDFLAAAASLGIGLSQTRSAAAPRPNLLLILADDLGFGDLSYQGAAQDIRTPHLDSLASSGVRFTNFYSNCPVCSPTRAALLSGRYPATVGVPGVIRKQPDDSWGYLAPSATLLPQWLSRAGYRTALTGKWHLGLEPANLPGARGFARFRGQLGGMLMDYYTHQEHQGIEPDMWNGTERIRPEGHATDLLTRWAVEEIREAGADRSRPFFHYLAYNAPHDPVQPPQEWLERVRWREPGISEQRARLVALIEHMDDGVGQVLAALKESGRERDTLVVFTSDNGGLSAARANNGPWRGGKGDVYEGGIRVPACARWPGRIAAGSSTAEVALSMDLAPTLAAAAGLEGLPPDLDGVDLLPLLTGQTRALAPRDLYWSRREGNPIYQGKTIDAVRRGNWKLVQNSPFGPLELFDLGADPGERRNLAAERPDVFRALAAVLRRNLQRGGAVPWQPPERVLAR